MDSHAPWAGCLPLFFQNHLGMNLGCNIFPTSPQSLRDHFLHLVVTGPRPADPSPRARLGPTRPAAGDDEAGDWTLGPQWPGRRGANNSLFMGSAGASRQVPVEVESQLAVLAYDIYDRRFPLVI